jgi:DMSO/TMAO reductase YedYZ molybdopterin-dependent catalytic subunit
MIEAFVTRAVGVTENGKKIGVWVVEEVDDKQNKVKYTEYLSKEEAWKRACKVNKEPYVEGDF